MRLFSFFLIIILSLLWISACEDQPDLAQVSASSDTVIEVYRSPT